jgi:uncharacterized protein YjdB
MSSSIISLCSVRHRSMAVLLTCATSLAVGCSGRDDATAPAPSTISVVELSQRTLTLGVGSSAALEVAVRDAAGNALPSGGVYWSSSDAAVASVSASGVVTALAVGSAKIAATLQGKSAVATVTVAPTPAAAVRLSPSELQLTVGQQGDLNATVVDANGAVLSGRVVAWRSSTASVAVVDSTGHVTAIAPGATSVTASSEGKSITAAVTVRAIAVASVRLTPANVSLVEGQSGQLTAEARDASGQVLSGRAITWSSSAPSVATVSSSGQAIAIAAGSATITATSEGQSATSAVSVSTRPVSSLVVSPWQLALFPGQGTTLSVLVTDANGTVLSGRAVSFSSASTAIATVSADGAVTAVAAGSTSITVTSEGKTARVPVTVAPTPAASIRVTPAIASVFVGSTARLAATVLDARGGSLDRPVSWSSGAPTVASVAQDGTVTGVGVGTAVILASAEGRVGSATVTVAAIPVATVTISPASSTLDPGGRTTLVASVQSASGAELTDRAVLWSSSDSKVATVSSGGEVTAVAPGVATITASAEGKSGAASLTVTKPAATLVGRVTVTPSIAAIVWTGPSNRTVQLTATAYTSAIGGTVIPDATFAWTTSNANVATVSATGLVTAIADGIVTITARSGAASATAVVSSSKR